MFGNEPMFVHIITLCLGLIIAYGLLQIVELFQRRRRERNAREASKIEDAPSDGTKPLM